jgi:hypothetical protein
MPKMTEISPEKNEVIFFFGAGASVDAEIPDTYTFATQFEEYVKNNKPQLYPALSIILEKRKTYNQANSLKPAVDVEQLLDTLRRLINKNKEGLLDFYDEKKFCANLERDDCLELKKDLEDFIRDKVVVKDIQKLDYLKELLKFDKPLEIYSTNYDTCIEQLSYLSHRRYSDGFNIDWNEKNFDGDYDIKHYKLHGSVIWFENVKTKQCVKIPAKAFYQKRPVELKLIYGEDIEPLLLYPAQKAEYIEPLTDLQLMFKKRLYDKRTRFVIFVGYSFKDSYVARMLWDAARVNENLHVILISPNANEIFEIKLKYTNKEQNESSRIRDRVLCVPYPFATVIYQLKNRYLHILRSILENESECEQAERRGENPEWKTVLQQCIEIGFLSKAEYFLEEKMRKDWNEVNFDIPAHKIQLGFKALIHSIITKDYYVDRWLKRLNDSLKIIDADNLRIHTTDKDFSIFFENQATKYSVEEIIRLIESLLNEKTNKQRMLSSNFENPLNCLDENINRLEKLKTYLDQMKKRITWLNYSTLRRDVPEKRRIDRLRLKLPSGLAQNFPSMQTPEKRLRNLTLTIESRELEKIFGEKTFQFKLDETQCKNE